MPVGKIDSLGRSIGFYLQDGNDCEEIATKTLVDGMRLYEKERHSVALFKIYMRYVNESAHEANLFVGDDLQFYYFDALTRTTVVLEKFLKNPGLILESVQVYR